MSAPYKIWQCRTCGYLYEEAEGDPSEGLAPGTRCIFLAVFPRFIPRFFPSLGD
jgi:hypothetical protein